MAVEQSQGFVVGQAQVLFVQLKQLPRQAQTRQMPVRALTTGDHHQQAIGQMIEEELQAPVQHRPLGEMVIVEHQQQRRGGIEMQRELVEQSVEPFFEGERLMALTHFQQAKSTGAQRRKIVLQTFEQALEKTSGIAVPWAQAQPETLPMRRQTLTELHRQRALAEPGRGADQQ